MKVYQLHEFAICTNSQGGNKRLHLMLKLVQLTSMHFLDLYPNSYDNLNKMKLDLIVCTKVKFRGNDQGI